MKLKFFEPIEEDFSQKIFLCECSSLQHQFLVSFGNFGDDEHPIWECYIHINLSKRSF